MNDNDNSYDELVFLAREPRSTRKRTNYWTTGLIVTGMAASTIYVATVNQQLADMSESAETAEVENFRLNVDVARLQSELDAVQGERDVYKQNAAWFASMAPALATPPSTTLVTPVGPAERSTPNFALSNLVWYVDGSRRFPMAANDILWVPEGQFWVRLESPGGDLEANNVKPTHITVHDGAEPPASTAGAQPRAAGVYPPGAHNLDDDDVYYEHAAIRGNANCVRIELADRTDRPQFGTNYVDMVVTFRNAPQIGNNPEDTDCQNGIGRRP